MARDPFFTLERGGALGDVTEFALVGGGGGGRWPAGFVGIDEPTKRDFEEGGGGGTEAENLGEV